MASGSQQSAYDPWDESREAEVAPPPVVGGAPAKAIAQAVRETETDRKAIRSAQPFGSGASDQALASWMRKAGIALRAGLDIRRFLDTEAERGSHHATMEFVRQRVAAGDTFTEAIRGSKWFPPMACDLIEMGEHAGRLEESLLRLADYYDHRIQLRRTFIAIVFFPLLQFFAAVGIVALAIWLVGTFSQGEMKILGLGGGSGAVVFLATVGMLIATVVAFVTLIVKGWFGSWPIRIAMKVPVLGSALESFALARLTWGFHSALEAGMDAKRCVEMSFRTTQNPLYVEKIPVATASVGAGREFHTAMRDTGVFPPLFLDMVENGETAGSLGMVLPRMTKDYEDAGRRNAIIAASAAGYLVWAGVAVFIISMIFSLAQNYLQILNDASKI